MCLECAKLVRCCKKYSSSCENLAMVGMKQKFWLENTKNRYFKKYRFVLLMRRGLLLSRCSLLKPVSAIWNSYPGERTQPPHLQVIFMLLTEQTKRITGTRLRI